MTDKKTNAPERIWAFHAPEALRMLLDYCPETGLFKWKSRSAELTGSLREANRFNAKHAGKSALTSNSHGYRRAPVMGKSISAHRAAFTIYHGRVPSVVDHINGDRSDNRISNLREVSVSENNRNARTRSDNTTGAAGVYLRHKKKGWQVRIGDKHVGIYLKFADAIEARRLALKESGYHENHGI